MEKPPTTSAAGGNDRISELPDEILHSILSHMLIAEEAARTCVLSSRWAYLWRSYPVVESSLAICQKFIESTMERFSRDEQLGMSALKIKVTPDEATFRSGACEQLLELASKRKAEYIQVKSSFSRFSVCCRLPLESLSNSAARSLRLERIRLCSFNNVINHLLIIPLNSLRSLSLESVQFDDEWIFRSLIASSPLLETLKIESTRGMRKLQISNLPNLKALTIYDCNQLEEIQMAAASELRTLHLRASSFGVSTKLTKVDLNAPQLSVLEMINTGLKIVDIQDVVSKLPCLKSLTLGGFFRNEKKLQLSSYELDELIISTKGLEEMELDASPHLQKLLLR